MPILLKRDYNTDTVIGMYHQDQPTDQNPRAQSYIPLKVDYYKEDYYKDINRGFVL